MTTLDDVRALAQSMVASPANAVQLAGELQTSIQKLPPPRADIITRPDFERAALWTYTASFENLPNSGIVQETQPIEVQRDVWVRSVSACAIVQQEEVGELPESYQFAGLNLGANNRWIFEVNWTLEDDRGFITRGLSEILAPGNAVTGDGERSAPVGWRLQKNSTIVVRARSLLAQEQPLLLEPDSESEAVLRWLVVNFWCEEIRQPGIARGV